MRLFNNCFGQKRIYAYSFLLIIIVAVTTACAPKTYRAHPQIETLAKEIVKPGLIPPDIKIYEISAGGVRELMDNWTQTGRENVTQSISGNLKDRCDLQTISFNEQAKEEIEDIQALYKAVSESINLHTYGPFIFPEKQKNFDYSIGSIEGLLEQMKADSLMFVYGVDEISTAGRKVLMVLATGLTGADYITAMSGLSAISIALVDRSGTVLWYNVNAAKGSYDLRDTESCSTLVKNILEDFPLTK